MNGIQIVTTQPEHLDTSIVFDYRISLKQLEHLFFDHRELPAFKAFLADMNGAALERGDIAWISERKKLFRDGLLIEAIDLEGETIILDMPCAEAHVSQSIVRLDLRSPWMHFLADEKFLSEAISFAWEIARKISSSGILFLPNEELEDYKFRAHYASVAASQAMQFDRVSDIVTTLRANGVKETLPHSARQNANTFMLVGTDERT